MDITVGFDYLGSTVPLIAMSVKLSIEKVVEEQYREGDEITNNFKEPADPVDKTIAPGILSKWMIEQNR